MPAWSMAKFSTDRQLTALVCVVTVLFCHVSCVIINVTRKSQDIFTNPISGTRPNCLDSGRVAACHQRNAKLDESHDGVCICKCSYPSSTFLESRLRCVGNSEMRNSKYFRRLQPRKMQNLDVFIYVDDCSTFIFWQTL